MSTAYQGNLFSSDFVESSIARLPDWQAISDADLHAAQEALAAVFARVPVDQQPNEAQTEDDLIWRVLGVLGWTQFLRQQNLTARGREDVPDGLLFADEAAKDRANAVPEEWRRYQHGAAVVESKRWLRPLDRRSERRDRKSTRLNSSHAS